MTDRVIHFGGGRLSISDPRNQVTVSEDPAGSVEIRSAATAKSAIFNLATFNSSGTLSVFTGKSKQPFPLPIRILGVMASVNTAPVGSDVVLDINVDNVSIFPTSPKPTVPDGQTVGAEVTAIDLPDVSGGSVVSVDIDQVGSTTPGDFLTVSVRYVFL